MSSFIKWLIFILLTAGYIYAVFFWNRSEAALTDQAELQQDETIQPEEQSAVEYTEAEESSDTEQYEQVSESVDPLPEESPIFQDPPVATSNYVIISGSYLQQSKADKALKDYTANYGINGQVKYYEPYYKVVLGSAGTKTEAKALLQEISDKGITAFIQKDS